MGDTGTDSAESMPLPSEQESVFAVEGEEGDQPGSASPDTKASKTSTKKDHPTNFKPKNGCQKCCGGVMHLFANDAIYGSFIGPHPVTVLCFCKPCKKCITPSNARPYLVASIVTKMMNFVMLGLVALLACFFIFPFASVSENDKVGTAFRISSFYPCDPKQGKNITNSDKNGGCVAHAGYFMTYRLFLAFAVVMITNAFTMLDVTSTKDDPYRKRIHHGFWLYKYLYLLICMFFFFFFPTPGMDKEGYFEYTISIIGNLAHVIFSFFELTVILDVVEMWVVSSVVGSNGWNNFMYTLITCILLIMDVIAYIAIFTHFAFKLQFNELELYKDTHILKTLGLLDLAKPPYNILVKDELNKTVTEAIASVNHKITEYERNQSKLSPTWPWTNCLIGTRKGDHIFNYEYEKSHLAMILTIGIVAIILVLLMILKRRFSKRYPYQSWLQVAIILSFILLYLWSALFNSEAVHSRPRCNWAMKPISVQDKEAKTPEAAIRQGTHDTYFRFPGFFHGVIALFTLIYFAFIHGPRSRTAPLSLGYRHFISGGYDREPVIPEPQRSPDDFKKAVEHLETWDDEKEKVAQSWTMFYLMMLFGSLSLMMSMTNFTDPWATARYNSSKIAMYFKFFTALGVALAYVCMLICPCTRVYKAYESPKRKRRVKKIVKPEPQPQEKQEGADEVQIEMAEEEDELSLYEDEEEEQPQAGGCGCLF